MSGQREFAHDVPAAKRTPFEHDSAARLRTPAHVAASPLLISAAAPSHLCFLTIMASVSWHGDPTRRDAILGRHVHNVCQLYLTGAFIRKAPPARQSCPSRAASTPAPVGYVPSSGVRVFFRPRRSFSQAAYRQRIEREHCRTPGSLPNGIDTARSRRPFRPRNQISAHVDHGAVEIERLRCPRPATGHLRKCVSSRPLG